MARSRNASSTSSTDFRADLGGDIKVQDFNTAAAHNRRASEAEAESIMLGVKSKIGAFEKLFSTGVEAGVGYLKNQQAKEILAELDKLEGFGQTALKNQQELDALTSGTGQYATIQEGIERAREQAGPAPTESTSMAGGSRKADHDQKSVAAVQEVMAAVDKEKARLLQGIQSQSQTITNIAAITKKYSAMLPGLADEFRKVAASKTGISNIDVLGAYTALTRTETADKNAQQVQLAYEKALVEHWGKPLEQITPEEQRLYAQLKAAEAQVDLMTKNSEIETATQAQLNSVSQATFQAQLGVSAANLQIKALKMMTANAEHGGKGALDFTMTQAVYSKALADENLRMQGVISDMRVKGMINENQEALYNKQLKDQMDVHEKWFANQENFNMWKRLNEVLAGDAAAQQAALNLNSPMMVWLGEIGLAPAIAENFWAAYQGGDTMPGMKEKFIRDYSEGLWNELERMATTEDQHLAAVYRRYLRDPSLSTDAMLNSDPETGRTVTALTLTESLDQLKGMKDPGYRVKGPEYKIAGSVLKIFTSGQTTPSSDPKSWAALQGVMDDGTLYKALDTMPPEVKEEYFSQIVTPFGQRLRDLYINTMNDTYTKFAQKGVGLRYDGSKWVFDAPVELKDSLVSGNTYEVAVNQLNKLNRMQTSFFKNVKELEDGYTDTATFSKQMAKGKAEGFTRVVEELKRQEAILEAELSTLKPPPTDNSADPESFDPGEVEYTKKRDDLRSKLKANREAQKQMESAAIASQASVLRTDPGEPVRSTTPGRTSSGTVSQPTPLPASEDTGLQGDELTATEADGEVVLPSLPPDADDEIKTAWDTLMTIDQSVIPSSVQEVQAQQDKVNKLYLSMRAKRGLAGYDELFKHIQAYSDKLRAMEVQLRKEGKLESFGTKNGIDQ